MPAVRFNRRGGSEYPGTHQVDLAQARNLCIVSVTLVFGIGGMVIGNDSFSLQGISLCGVVAIVLNLILPKGEDENVLPHQ